MKRITFLTVAMGLVLCVAGPSMASGFSIYEHSAKASGQAGAWVARADDAAANWYNPAALVRQGASFQIGFSGITIGADTKLKSGPFVFEPESSVGTPVHVYYGRKATKNLAWGIGVNTPYGLSTEWSYPVSLSAKKSELAAFNVNFNVAYAMNEYWSFAFGVDYLIADIKNFSTDFDQSDFNPFLPPATLATQNLSGDGADLGFNMGLLYRSDAWAFALTYRSGMTVDIDGTLEFTDVDDSIAAFFPDTVGSTVLPIPAQGAVGFAYTGLENFEFEFDVSWASWSDFDALHIRVEGLPDLHQAEDWSNTSAYRLGGQWNVGERHEFGLGVLYDENPVPDHTLRPSIPDADRYAVTAGWGWAGRTFDIDVYYMGLFFEDRTIGPNPFDPSVIPGKYESFSNLFGVTVGWRFD